MQIQGQTALVTGAASGLGEATARELARLGAKVAVLDVNAALAQTVADSLNAQHGTGTAIACACDITNTDSVQAALNAAQAALGPARILMNIAGIGTAKRVVGKDGNAAPLEDFARVINVNLIGAYNSSRLFATPLMRTLPEPVQQSLAASIPFPSRLGKPEEFAELACHIVSNDHLNGEVIRLDGALRMAPR